MLRAEPAPRILTVTQLAALVREALEGGVGSVWVAGEISNLRRAPSGHVYFTLKDEQSQLDAVLFRSGAQALAFRPADGMEVLIYGRVGLYPARGALQLYVDTMEPRGLGALQLAFEQLKARLGAEGLFAAGRKRPLPPFPRPCVRPDAKGGGGAGRGRPGGGGRGRRAGRGSDPGCARAPGRRRTRARRRPAARPRRPGTPGARPGPADRRPRGARASRTPPAARLGAARGDDTRRSPRAQRTGAGPPPRARAPHGGGRAPPLRARHAPQARARHGGAGGATARRPLTARLPGARLRHRAPRRRRRSRGARRGHARRG